MRGVKMKELLIDFIKNLKTNKRINSFDEATTKQAVILKLLSILEWDIFNDEEVKPEYKVSSKSVDYCLRIANTNKVFLEIKKIREDLEKHQEQLLNYSFQEGIKLAVLTNGITWWLYLPLYEGSWEQRRFYAIDILQQKSDEIALKFIDFLSKDNIITGKAHQNAEEIYKSRKKQTVIKDTLPKVWEKIVSEPDKSLVELLSETTEKVCGYKPEFKEIEHFLRKIKKMSITQLESPYQIPRGQGVTKTVISGENISCDVLIQHIIKVLGRHEEKVTKKQVEEEIYQTLREIFELPYYQENPPKVFVPRWQHNIAWAKEKAKGDGLVKWPADSGRGYWELTQKGREYYQKMISNNLG